MASFLNSSRKKQFLLVSFCIIVIVLSCFDNSNTLVQAASEDAGKKKAKKSKKKGKTEPTLFSGATPSGSTDWKSESSNSISTEVTTVHLPLSKTPVFFTSLSSRFKLKSIELDDLESKVALLESAPMANLTGSNAQRKESIKGFSVRLRYDSEDGRNVTGSIARMNNWRIKWVAVTDASPLLESNEELSATRSYLKLLNALVMENPVLIKPLIGKEYELPMSLQPKPNPPVEIKVDEETDSKAKKEEEGGVDNSEEKSKTDSDDKEDKPAEESTKTDDEQKSEDSAKEPEEKEASEDGASKE